MTRRGRVSHHGKVKVCGKACRARAVAVVRLAVPVHVCGGVKAHVCELCCAALNARRFVGRSFLNELARPMVVAGERRYDQQQNNNNNSRRRRCATGAAAQEREPGTERRASLDRLSVVPGAAAS